MIAFAHDLLVEHLLQPQTLEGRGETRVTLDLASMPIGTDVQEIDVRDMRTRPVAYEIGGSVQLRHTVDVALEVRHGDALEARRLRDLILTEIMVRLVRGGSAAMRSAEDTETGQQVESVAVSIDYTRPLPATDTNETATLVFDVDVTLDG